MRRPGRTFNVSKNHLNAVLRARHASPLRPIGNVSPALSELPTVINRTQVRSSNRTLTPRCQISPHISVCRHRLMHGELAYRRIPEHVPVGFDGRPFLYWRMANPVKRLMQPVVLIALDIPGSEYRQSRRRWLVGDQGVNVQRTLRAVVS
jgi:hypothetical protein